MWLKQLRSLFGKTQKEVAEESGVNKLTIENLEQLRRKGSEETLTTLLQYFSSLNHISYSCDDLIEELEEDIDEFGEDKLFYAMFEIKAGCFFLTNYDFICEEQPLTNEEKEKYAFILKLQAKDILELMKIQNKIIKL